MKSRRRLSRRTLLRGAGVSVALPLLDAMTPFSPFGGREPEARRRLVAIDLTFGLHPPFFRPVSAGRGYQATPYLEVLGDLRDHLTVITGCSHPGVTGGHLAEPSFLTAAPHPASQSFRNTVSLDQVAAATIGDRTRFASLALTTGIGGLSFSRTGVEIPAQSSPSKVFARLFLSGGPELVERQVARLRAGRSVMDAVLEEARRLRATVGGADRDKLDEYFTAVRETEESLRKAQEWAGRPKPDVRVPPPRDIQSRANVIGRALAMYDLIHLALQTDSTRLLTLKNAGADARPPIPGVELDYHNLTHHGMEPKKIAQLQLIEIAQMKAFRRLLQRLRSTPDGDGTLLDHTIVLFGSTLGNGSNHDNRNLPVILAGGGFHHGRHLAFDPASNEPLPNLFVSILQRLGLEVDRFASSTGALRDLTW